MSSAKKFNGNDPLCLAQFESICFDSAKHVVDCVRTLTRKDECDCRVCPKMVFLRSSSETPEKVYFTPDINLKSIFCIVLCFIFKLLMSCTEYCLNLFSGCDWRPCFEGVLQTSGCRPGDFQE